MAEQVQAALDQMVAPLRDLMDRNIFSETEIKAIVARRRESEYLLRRRAARKADFLRYIEAEEMLEELRKLRTEQRKRDHRKSQEKNSHDENGGSQDLEKNGKKKEEQHIGDIHIQMLIHLLFTRAIRKFRSDLSLHLLHVDFCKKNKSWTKLGKVYAEALQIFPRKSGLWIEAASHEFFGPLKSIRNARVLLQRGLRILPKDEDIWIQYFTLELHYAQTLKGRRKILIKGGGIFEEEDVDDELDSEDKYQYIKIPLIVYRNAIKAVPDSISFRLRFLETCRGFPDTQDLMNSIQEPLLKNFGSQPEAWIARAMYEAEKVQNGNQKIESSDGLATDDKQAEPITPSEDEDRPSKRAKLKDPVVATLEEGIRSVGTEAMKLHAFRFAQQYLKEQGQKRSVHSTNETEKLIREILESSAEQVTSADLALEQADYHVLRGHEDNAVRVLERFCRKTSDEKLSTAPASIWIRWASLFEENRIATMDIFKKALGAIAIDRPDYIHVLLQFFGCLLAAKESDKQALNDTFQEILLMAPTSWDVVVHNVTDYWFGLESIAHAFVQYLNRAASEFGLKSVRRIYNAVLFHSTIHFTDTNEEYLISFIDKCLKLEESNKTQLRRLYDQTVELLKGTQWEKKYRQDRNDSVIFQ